MSMLLSTSVTVASDVSSYWLSQIYFKILEWQKWNHYTTLCENATNYDQWAAAASQLDKLEGVEKWQDDPTSPYYEYQLIQDRLAQFIKARESKDLSSMLFLLRTSLCRNLGDMGHHKLYGVCRVGTKKLIEHYITEVCRQMDMICETDHDDFPAPEKYEFFMNAQKAFGRTALLFSGGAIFGKAMHARLIPGLAHIGVVKSLYETRLLPRIISGSSVGSIVAAVVCTRTDEELPSVLDTKNINLNVFERPSERGGWLLKLHRIIQNQILLENEVFIDAMRQNIGDLTFQEAFYRTRRILNVTVSSSTLYEMPRLLNYLTAPNVLIWSAVAASCAIPGVYRSTPLMFKEKNGHISTWNPSGHKWIDGSVENDLPMARISELFGVNHFIVSQVNPHVTPALRLMSIPYWGSMIRSASFIFWSEVQHWINQLIDLGFSWSLLYRIQSIVRQKYSGDITIVPPIPLSKLTEIMKSPDPEMVMYYTTLGDKATWPLISTIKNHLQIELCIDELLYRLRVRKLGAIVGFSTVTEKAPFATSRVELLDVDILRAMQGRSSNSDLLLKKEEEEKDRMAGIDGVEERKVVEEKKPVPTRTKKKSTFLKAGFGFSEMEPKKEKSELTHSLQKASLQESTEGLAQSSAPFWLDRSVNDLNFDASDSG